MASAEADGSELPQKAACPYCTVKVDRDDDGSFPPICLNCGEELPENLGISTCPNCGKDRKTLANGALAKFCRCRYNFATRTVSQKGTCVIWQHIIVLHK